MTTKHTQGPWHRNIRANGKYPVIFSGRNQHVALATQQADGAETEANIDLIAAAPALLEALKMCLNCTDMNLDELDDTTAEAIKIARAAIAKAEGQV